MSDTTNVTRVEVDLGERSYPIHIGRNLPVGEILAEMGIRRALLVSDTNVAPLHGERMLDALRAGGATVATHTIAAGEPSKSFATIERLCRDGAMHGLDRRSHIVALGGGVVGDIAGFLASCCLRGIRWIQAPTTLLAMVDSSVGGKTGINIEEGKNLVGAFYQPSAVLADLAFLDTLPGRDYISGLAETLKYGLIADASLFDDQEGSIPELLRRDPARLTALVRRSCEIKADVVGRDEKEGGLRAILNFGHTLGHALENVAGYGTLLHGEAVAIGMAFATRVSREVCGLSGAAVTRIESALERMGLPVGWSGYDWDAVQRAMASDKKSVEGSIRWVLLEAIGKAVHGVSVPLATLRDVFVRENRNSA